MRRSLQQVRTVFLARAAAFGLASAGAQEPAERVLDAFEEIAPWTAAPSDDVRASLAQTQGETGRALRFSFDFGGGAGYAAIRRALPLELPENYEISFQIRGEAPANNLEFKLTDESGENVWWSVRRDYAFPREWTRMAIRKRQIEFAWGPTQDRRLRRAAHFEFVVSAGAGGAGAIEIDNLTIRELPPAPISYPAPTARATSSQVAFGAELGADGRLSTQWRSDPAGGRAQDFILDFGSEREFGGLVLRWVDGAYASRYDVEFSHDGVDWRLARRVEDGDGGADPVLLTESEARYVRLRLLEGPGAFYGLAEAEIRDLAFGATPQAFFQALACEAPRGAYPRGMRGEQNYWTLVGVDGGGARSALFSEDGALELGPGGASVEPFVIADGRVFSWADIEITQALRENYLPIPSVLWRGPGWELRTTALADGAADAPRLLHRYELTNASDHVREFSLVLAVRPFQVNPPQQFLGAPAGFSPINEIAWTGAEVAINGAPRLRPLRAPDAVRAAPFDDGAWIGAARGEASAASEQGFAAAALVYRLRLAPGQHAALGFVSSLTPNAAPTAPRGATLAWLDRRQEALTREWRGKLGHVSFAVPAEGARVVNTLRSSIATMLMSRDGPALRPGTRSYARSWIRDGAMMAEGLLRVGLAGPARDYLDWYAPYQFENGKVPCCVDARGADPVPENDSHGELIHLAALVHRYTGDRATLDRAWPHVEAAARYMESLRQSERIAANQTPERAAYFGLMPPSISHEGYSARPAYSYWDDFWALRGFEDAVYLADARGDGAGAARLGAQRDEFSADLFASIAASSARFGVNYIPGAADLGDFDATSTTIAIAPAGQQARLPQALLYATFERYWTNFVARRDGTVASSDYTPYELRVVGTFVRLGWRARANEALEFFFRDQRPQAWNQWAEVVGRDMRAPRFVGDMPHGWVASDYLRSALDMFAYERAEDAAIVLAAGVPESWFAERGFAVRGLETPYGRLDYSIRRDGTGYRVRIDGAARPPSGFVVALPSPEEVRFCVNGAPVAGREIKVDQPRTDVRIRPC